MALIDKEKLLVPLSEIVSNLRTYTAPDVIAADNWTGLPEGASADTETRGSEFFERAIPLLETFVDIIAAEEPVNPLHHAGGCYCRECKRWDTERKGYGEERLCNHWSEDALVDQYTLPTDFCSYGCRKEEGADERIQS